MKKLLFGILAVAAALAAFNSCKSGEKAAKAETSPYLVVAYLWDGGDKLPDPNSVTTINYAFANMNETRDGLVINNPERFAQVLALREQNPDLKVLVTLGGTCASGLSEMAADSAKRASTAGDCRRIVEKYDLAGIDLDWEFPGGEGGTPQDRDNYTLFIRALRDSIGPDRLLTIAGGGDLPYLDVPATIDCFDYFNVMAYDLTGRLNVHHTSLYRSPLTGWRSVEEVLATDYYPNGITPDKIVLGLGFYGRGDEVNFPGWTNYGQIDKFRKDWMTTEWDSIACVPYIADSTGVLLLGYDDPRSLKIKCDYIKDKKFLGAMYWRVECDNDSFDLARTVEREMLVDFK